MASIEMTLILLFGGLFILLLECFIPSGGVLLVLSLLCISGSVVVAFLYSTLVGWSVLAAILVLAPGVLFLGFQIWKRSPIGRLMFLESPAGQNAPDRTQEATDEGGNGPTGPEDASLLGQVGKTLTLHRPSGMTEILGQRVDTVAEGVMIDRGEVVKVVEIRGNRIVVRKVSTERSGADSS